jgi:chemosensory pili system protein ChpA (sensor histidine kinase/response regulator)
LTALLGGQPAVRDSLSRRILLVADSDQIALEVDEVLGFKELVAQPLGPQLAGLQRFTGGSVLSDGRQELILDLGRLMASPSPVSTHRLSPESMQPVALVVDDSLTMRVATMRMLEERGISARAARDGIEALDAMAAAWPDLLIVDIDMPRLDGFELLSRLRMEYGDSLPPVIMISSRDALADRQRAEALGVRHYLLKPWTDALLQEALTDVGLRLPDLTIA